MIKPCPLCEETDILQEDSNYKCTNCSCEAMIYDWDVRPKVDIFKDMAASEKTKVIDLIMEIKREREQINNA